MADNYRTLRLPNDLVEEVERSIKENPQTGYTSLPEFVKESVRLRLEETDC